MTLNLDKYPQPLELSLWVIVLAAGGTGVANIEFYQTKAVDYTRQAAIEAALKQLASEMPELYQRGQALGGWRATHVDGLSVTYLEGIFTDRANLERKLETEKVRMEQNQLIKQIITDRDIPLFHQAILERRITNYERLYIHDKLTEHIDTGSTPEMIVSPIQP